MVACARMLEDGDHQLSGDAALATVGIFLPAFVFVALSAPLVPRLRRSPAAGAFLDAVKVASLPLMAVVAGQLAALHSSRQLPAGGEEPGRAPQ